jgi:cyclopropane fatty-acyl-phospholipid synthase-like methyltransferase
MTSGYYDYEKIVGSILSFQPFQKILEIGCGTGLILQELASQRPLNKIMGVDLTESMLQIAKHRLQHFSNVSLSVQNVIHLSLKEQYDMAFSYGGVWYFVIDGDKEPFMVSHLKEDANNHQSLERLSQFIQTGGKLLLGIQGPHHDYETVIKNGMKYSQKITPASHGFIKDYFLKNKSDIVMEQTIHYRTYSFTEALNLLETYGFKYQPNNLNNPLFLEFIKV